MHDREVINARKRGIRTEIEHHRHVLETLTAQLAELEKDDDRRRVKEALQTIENALTREISIPKGEYASGVMDGIKMTCEEIKKVLLRE